jgi:hypothetical protein
MTTFVKVAGAAVSALVLSAALAQAASPGTGAPLYSRNNGINPGIAMKPPVGCNVAGGGEFSNDVKLFNKGVSSIAKGTSLHWTVPTTGQQGNYVLPADLAAGQVAHLLNVLSYVVMAGTDCKASY